MDLEERIKAVKLLVCDVDGVLTDGSITYGTGNVEVKTFNIKDGLAMKVASLCQFPVVLLTGRRSEPVVRRANELNAQLRQGVNDKESAMLAITEEYGVTLDEIAYVGDDLNDLPALRLAGLPIAVADAVPDVRAVAAYVTAAAGGDGAIREIIELLFRAQGRWEQGVEAYLAHLRGAPAVLNPHVRSLE